MSNANVDFWKLLHELLDEVMLRAAERKVSLYQQFLEEHRAVNSVRELRERGRDESGKDFPDINRVLWGLFEARFYFFDTIIAHAVRTGRVSDEQVRMDTKKLLMDNSHLFPTLRATDNGTIVVD